MRVEYCVKVFDVNGELLSSGDLCFLTTKSEEAVKVPVIFYSKGTSFYFAYASGPLTGEEVPYIDNYEIEKLVDFNITEYEKATLERIEKLHKRESECQ